MTAAPAKNLTARAMARELGISQQALMRLHDKGAIDAVIREPGLIRFNADSVKQSLAKRARENRESTTEVGIVPTL